MKTKIDETKKRSELFKKLVDLQKKIDKCKDLFDQRDNLYFEISKLGLGDFFYSECFVSQDTVISELFWIPF